MQTIFNDNPEFAIPGLLADNSDYDGISRAAEGEIPFGRFCVLGTNVDKQVKLPSSSAEITTLLKNMGISVLDQSYVSDPTMSAPGVKDTESLDILRQGRIYVQVEEAVTPESAVYVRYAGIGQISKIVFDADFVASNSIAMDINAVAITPVAFNTDHATTMTDLATEIQSNSDIVSATVSASREITIIAASSATDIVVSGIVVTGGLSQPAGVFSVVEAHRLATDKGKFRASADSTTAALVTAGKMRYMSSADADGFAVLEVNL